MNKALFDSLNETFGRRVSYTRLGACLDGQEASWYRWAATNETDPKDVEFNLALAAWLEDLTSKREAKKVAARRRRRANLREAYESAGMVRVRGALGGVYYE